MTCDELIAQLQALPAAFRKLPVRVMIGKRMTDSPQLWMLATVMHGQPTSPAMQHLCIGRPLAEPMADDAADHDLRYRSFHDVWCQLAKDSHCDAWGGMECARVWKEWNTVQRSLIPEEIAAFIRKRANLIV